MRNSNLLVVSSPYPLVNYGGVFVKDQVDFIKEEFYSVNVVAPMSYFPKSLFGFDKFRDYSRYTSFPVNYSYGNVRVYFAKHMPLPTFKMFSKVRVLQSSLAANRLVKCLPIRFDLVHSHFLLPEGYIGALLKEKYHVPFVVTAHGGDIYTQPFIDKWWRAKTEYVLMKANRVITTSRRNSSIIEEMFGIDKRCIRVIGNGFDPNSFFPIDKGTARLRLGLPLEGRIVLSIGNLLEIKGHRFLIEAMKEVCSEFDDASCIIIGTGDQKATLNKQVAKSRIKTKIRFIYGVPHNEIPLWLNSCDVFVLPSLDEGFPTVVPEALGCGRPVVASSVGGVPEAVVDESLGVLVPPHDSDELARGILFALTRSWNQAAISEYAKTRYSWKKIVTEILKVYTEALMDEASAMG